MQVLHLLSKAQLPFELGNVLGEGADGKVFQISDNKVVKISVSFDEDRYHDSLSHILDLLIQDPKPVYARLFEHGFICETERPWYPKTFQKCFLYYYIMEKLEKISEDEKRVFHTILSHEDRGIIKNYSDKEIEAILKDLGRGLDFSDEKVKNFYRTLRGTTPRHGDFHPRNIMKTKYGDFKMIDFDRMILEN